MLVVVREAVLYLSAKLCHCVNDQDKVVKETTQCNTKYLRFLRSKGSETYC